jgi:hypothetical protein
MRKKNQFEKKLVEIVGLRKKKIDLNILLGFKTTGHFDTIIVEFLNDDIFKIPGTNKFSFNPIRIYKDKTILEKRIANCYVAKIKNSFNYFFYWIKLEGGIGRGGLFNTQKYTTTGTIHKIGLFNFIPNFLKLISKITLDVYRLMETDLLERRGETFDPKRLMVQAHLFMETNEEGPVKGGRITRLIAGKKNRVIELLTPFSSISHLLEHLYRIMKRRIDTYYGFKLTHVVIVFFQPVGFRMGRRVRVRPGGGNKKKIEDLIGRIPKEGDKRRWIKKFFDKVNSEKKGIWFPSTHKNCVGISIIRGLSPNAKKKSLSDMASRFSKTLRENEGLSLLDFFQLVADLKGINITMKDLNSGTYFETEDNKLPMRRGKKYKYKNVDLVKIGHHMGTILPKKGFLKEGTYDPDDFLDLTKHIYEGTRYKVIGRIGGKKMLTIEGRRKLEYIKKIINNTIICSYDIETIYGSVKPYAIGYFVGVKGSPYMEFFGKNCLTDMVINLKLYLYKITPRSKIITTYEFYGHYGGGFDIPLLLEHLLNNGFIPRSALNQNGKFTEIKTKLIFKGKFIINVNFKDSSAFLKGGLRDIGNNFNCEIIKSKIDFRTIRSFVDVDNNRKSLSDYLRKDVLSLHEIMVKLNFLLRNNFGLGLAGVPTISSYSSRVFRKNFYKPKGDNILVGIFGELDEKLRKGFAGGMTCNQYRGHFKNIYGFDFTSLYPFVQSTFFMPTGIPKIRKDLVIGDILEGNIFGFLIGKVKGGDPRGVNLHSFKKTNGYLIFPYFKDFHNCVIFSEEIRLADTWSMNYEYIIEEFVEFKRGQPFKEYIDQAFKLKDDASKKKLPALRTMAKLILNSSYGTFAFNPEKDSVSFKRGKYNIFNSFYNGSLKDFRKLGRYWMILESNYIERDTNAIHIGMAITSYGRMMTWRLIKSIEKFGGKAIYWDTDSVYTDLDLRKHKFFQKYFSKDGKNTGGSHLGGLKLEKICKEFICIGPKVYATKEENGKITIMCRGFSQKNKFKDKTYDLIDKKVILEGHGLGEEMITFEDMDLVLDDWKLSQKVDQLRGGLTKLFNEYGNPVEQTEIIKIFDFSKKKNQKGIYRKGGDKLYPIILSNK